MNEGRNFFSAETFIHNVFKMVMENFCIRSSSFFCAVRRLSGRFLLPCGLLLGATISARGADETSELPPLLSNSPFIPEGWAPPADRRPANKRPNPALNPGFLEFRGYYTLRGVSYFNFHNKRTRKSFWISEGEEKESIRIAQWNVRDRQLILRVDGKLESFSMSKPEDRPMAVASTPVSGPPSARPGAPPRPPVRTVRPPTPSTQNMRPPTGATPTRSVTPPRRVVNPATAGVGARANYSSVARAHGNNEGDSGQPPSFRPTFPGSPNSQDAPPTTVPSSSPPTSGPPSNPPSGPPPTLPPNFIPPPPPSFLFEN